MGNGSGDLEDYHIAFYSDERFCGGFVWEWCDYAGILGYTDDGKAKYGYGGDFGEKHHDGNFCMDALTYPDRTPHTGLLELKQVYRPVRVKKGCASGLFVFESMLEFENAGNILDCRYEITFDGGVLSEGGVDFSVPPMVGTAIHIPEAAKSFDRDTYIRFIFTAKNDTSYCKKGYEVCFDQINLFSTEKQAEKRMNGRGAVLNEDAFYVNVSAEDTEYRFNKKISAFDSIKHKGKELLDRPLEYNFFRAPTDNDVMKNDWYSAHLNDHEIKNYGVMAELAPKGALIALKQAFVWNIYQPIAYMNTRYVISSSGLDISCKAEFSNKVTFLPRSSIRLFMPRSFDRVEYFGLGSFESYIDKHQADRMDNFSENISDMHEDYIRPQENSSHFGCKHMTVSDGETKVKFTSDEDFSFNASEYTQEELSEKRHNFELEKCGSSVICVDHMMAGVGSAACGPALSEKYRLPLPEISASFCIQIS